MNSEINVNNVDWIRRQAAVVPENNKQRKTYNHEIKSRAEMIERRVALAHDIRHCSYRSLEKKFLETTVVLLTGAVPNFAAPATITVTKNAHKNDHSPRPFRGTSIHDQYR
jgi:hypothetical protein